MQRFGRYSLLLGWTIGVLFWIGCSNDAPVASGSAEDAAQSELLREVRDWGPKRTRAGTPFNRLPEGPSAFWILGTGERQVAVELAGRPLPTVVGKDVVTAAVSQELVETLLAQPGSYELALTSPAGGRRQRVGDFQVE